MIISTSNKQTPVKSFPTTILYIYNTPNQIFLGSTTKGVLTGQDCSLSDKVNSCTAL